jgi:hypothetical protein
MRVLLIFVVLLLNAPATERELIVSEKIISVHGVTSIGKFKCNYSKNSLKDTLFVNHTKHKRDLIFDIPVQNFSCGNFVLNSDFRKTIKADEFPHARVKVSNLKSNGKNYTCDMTVNLVGKTLEFKGMELTGMDKGLKGHLSLSFDDLDLTTPRKFGGLVKVQEDLHLEIFLAY